MPTIRLKMRTMSSMLFGHNLRHAPVENKDEDDGQQSPPEPPQDCVGENPWDPSSLKKNHGSHKSLKITRFTHDWWLPLQEEHTPPRAPEKVFEWTPAEKPVRTKKLASGNKGCHTFPEATECKLCKMVKKIPFKELKPPPYHGATCGFCRQRN